MVLILILLALYVTGLILLATWVDRHPGRERPAMRALVYSLSLLVFNSSWFYMVGIGTAAAMAGIISPPILAASPASCCFILSGRASPGW